MDDEILERNKNLNRGFRKLRVWREDIRGQKSEVGGRKKTEVRGQKSEDGKRQKSGVRGRKSEKDRGRRSEVGWGELFTDVCVVKIGGDFTGYV